MDLYNWILSGIAVAGYILVANLISSILADLGKRKKAAPKRAKYISKVFNFLLAILTLFGLFIIWGYDYHNIFVVGSSLLAIGGVALFAQWSILSNLTASIVIFFNYPSRIGDRIRILDGENSVDGVILDINMFQVLIEDDNKNVVNYPNNLLIQKPLVKLSGKKEPVVEKVAEDNGEG